MKFDATQPFTLTLNHPSLPAPVTVTLSNLAAINWSGLWAFFLQVLPLILPFLTPTQVTTLTAAVAPKP